MITIKPVIKTTLASRNFHETEPFREISENLHLVKIPFYGMLIKIQAYVCNELTTYEHTNIRIC